MEERTRTLCPCRAVIVEEKHGAKLPKPARCILSGGHKGNHTNGVYRWALDGETMESKSRST